jgi:hypothetical protein
MVRLKHFILIVSSFIYFILNVEGQCNHYSTTSACAALNAIPPLPDCGNFSGKINNETAFFAIVGDYGLAGNNWIQLIDLIHRI